MFTLDHKIEKLTLEYYDQNFSKIWKREFENTVSAYYDYTKNNIYLSADNSLHIIDLATGEDTFQHTFIGEKQEIRKMADGVLCMEDSEDFQVLAITTMVSSFVAEWYDRSAERHHEGRVMSLEIIRNEISAVQQELLLKLEIKSIAMLEYAPKQDSEAC